MKNNNRKGKLIAVAAAGVLGLSLLVGSISSFATSGRVGFIGEAKAKQIALSNTGLKEAEVTFVRTTLDFDNGNYEYDVEFYKGNVEYDYEIDAKTGRILSYDKEIEGFNISGKTSSNTTTTTKPNNNTNTDNSNSAANQAITAEKAKEIALKHVGLKAEEVSFIKAELDKERGQTVYDVEFYKGNVEYDFEIDAKTGKILDFDKDIENFAIPSKPKTNTSPNNSGISLEKAKETALQHAGFTAAQVTFTKSKLDYDDGRSFYDIEFRAGRAEYDFEIDVKTGKVLDYDYDLNDGMWEDDRDYDYDEDNDDDDDEWDD